MAKGKAYKFSDADDIVEKRIVAGVARFGNQWKIIAEDEKIGFEEGVPPDALRGRWRGMLKKYPVLLKDFKKRSIIPEELRFEKNLEEEGEASGGALKSILEQKVDTLIDFVTEVYNEQADQKKTLTTTGNKVTEILSLMRKHGIGEGQAPIKDGEQKDGKGDEE